MQRIRIALLVLLSIFIVLFSSSIYSQEGDQIDYPMIVYLSNFAAGSYQVFAVNPDGTEFSQLTNTLTDLYTRDVYGVDCVRQNDLIGFNTVGGLYQLDIRTGILTELLFGDNYDDLSWSPDGTQVAFSAIRFPSPNHEIYILNTKNGNITQLTSNSYADLEPAWSPDGQKIAFAYRDRSTYGIATIGVDGTNQVRITEMAEKENSPSWSPDGQKIAFASERDDSTNIYIMQADGSGVNQVTTGSDPSINPAWSPDGTMLSFSSKLETDSYQIYVMNSDGSNIRRVTNNVDTNINKCWLFKGPITPTANAGSDRTITDSDDNGSERVMLDGSGSSDSDGSIESYSWQEEGEEIARGVNPTVDLAIGTHTITLVVTDDDGATARDEVVIEVVRPSQSPSAPAVTPEITAEVTPDAGSAPSVTGFVLVDADADADLRPLEDGDTITEGTITIRVETAPPIVGSVVFGLDDEPRFKVENEDAYALKGDDNGDYHAWLAEPGTYTLTATPYTEADGQGEAGTPLTIRFTVEAPGS